MNSTSRRLLFASLTALALTLLMAVSWNAAVYARGNFDYPPEKGGLTYSLGMPPVYKGFSGFEMQSFRTSNAYTELAAFLNAGVYKDLGSPIIGIAALSLEGYGGVRGTAIDGGARANFLMPNLGLGVGADWNATDGDIVALFRLDLPIRRGGILGRATTLTFRWLPAREQTLSLGINAPLWGRNLGATRPKRDNVKLDDRRPERLEMPTLPPELESELKNLAERMHWVAWLTQPFAEHSGADPVRAMQPYLDPILAHIDSTDADFPHGHDLPSEITAYHESLARAFSLAFGASSSTDPSGGAAPGLTDQGREASSVARRILLDDVIFPYNRLLGQRKTHDSLTGMIAIAQTEFGSWVLQHPAIDMNLDNERIDLIWLVFQTLCDDLEKTRAELKERWEDSRFVWLPLQYGFTPEECDTQEEMDHIIECALKRRLTPENRVWYVINEQFQYEFASSVRLAEDYHVLWIHDYRGKTAEGKPDRVAFEQTLNYLQALTERALAYDHTGKMPMYLILLDQHYFELNKGRLWLRLLTKPLDEHVSLPKEFSEWENRLQAAQDELRDAVDQSLLLSLGRSQYGEDWLKNLIKVHVNITNPADPSFRSMHSMGIFPVPDALMRDHRKIFFYDITEDDPYRGLAAFTGMGIGEHYTGPNWEDRAILIRGPGALAVKTAARELLVAQGLEDDEIPYPLRARPFPDSYANRLAEYRATAPSWLDDRGKVIQLHNETGFHPKPIDVAKAVLYNLMPAGSVLNIPDSLWQDYLYASLLAGSALRGCRALIIAPTLESAPSAAAPTMARAHGLMGRLIVFSNTMDPEMLRHGGLLKVGLYAPKQGVGDWAGRFQQAANTRVPWKSRVFFDHPEVTEFAKHAPAFLDSIGYKVRYFTQEGEVVKPKLHLKANFFASPVAWNKLGNRPEFPALLRTYLQYLAEQSKAVHEAEEARDLREFPQALAEVWMKIIHNILEESTPREREQLMYYFTVGSVNMDYRSMVMDGEVMTLVSHWQALYGFLDFLMLPGLCEWMDTPEELNEYLPPPGGWTRTIAGFMKLSL